MGENRTLVYIFVWILGVWFKVTSQQVSAGMEQSIQTETRAPAHLSFSLLKHHLLLKNFLQFSCTHAPWTCKYLHELVQVLILILNWELSAFCVAKGQRSHRISVPGHVLAVPEWPRSGPGQPRAPCSSRWAPSAAHLGGKEQQWGVSTITWQNSLSKCNRVKISLANIFNKRERRIPDLTLDWSGLLRQTKAILRAEAPSVRIHT